MSEQQHPQERPTMRTLNDKLDAQRELLEQKMETQAAEQKTQHTITRAVAILAGLPNLGKALTLVGFTYLHWTEYLPWHF